MSDVVGLFINGQPVQPSAGVSVTDKLIQVIHDEFVDDEIRDIMVTVCQRRRDDIGIKKYGHELKTNNGRFSPADVVQEQYDLTLYTVQCWMEGYVTYEVVFEEVVRFMNKLKWIKLLKEQLDAERFDT